MRGVLGRLAGALIVLACFWGGQEILVSHEPANLSIATRAGYAAWLVAAYVAGMVVHELGHAAAIRLVGSRVDAIQFGGRLLRFMVAGVPVSVGIGLGGHVEFDARRIPAARQALVLLAGRPRICSRRRPVSCSRYPGGRRTTSPCASCRRLCST